MGGGTEVGGGALDVGGGTEVVGAVVGGVVVGGGGVVVGSEELDGVGGESLVGGGATVVGGGTDVGLTPCRFAGGGNCSTGSPSNARRRNSPQICAGKVPPVTWSTPPTSCIASVPSPLYMPTVAVSWGTKPLNHADLLSSLVPDLPAAGRPRSPAATPEPSVTT